jgi:hypothetical protein
MNIYIPIFPLKILFWILTIAFWGLASWLGMMAWMAVIEWYLRVYNLTKEFHEFLREKHKRTARE